MSGLEIDWKLSVGNILTIGAVLSGLAAGWFGMQYQVNHLQREMSRLQVESAERVHKFESIAMTYESRIRAVEIAQASTSADLRSIQTGINEIKEQLRRIGGPHQ